MVKTTKKLFYGRNVEWIDGEGMAENKIAAANIVMRIMEFTVILRMGRNIFRTEREGVKEKPSE